ncbi:hypothetical protein ACKKBG_A23195 [Auxenochlorella protothecoides x Auxenochlorella symbiontica]
MISFRFIVVPGATLEVQALAGDTSSSQGALDSFQAAVEAARLRSIPGSCHASLSLGARPVVFTSDLYGNACEPEWTREAINLVRSLLSLQGAGQGLEWGAGSSTLWLLSGLIGQLESVEHDVGVATRVNATMQSAFGAEDLQARWRLRVVPPAGPVLTFLQAESYEHYFTAYVEAPENREGAYSFIAVQGMARLAALRRAVKLLQPSGGVLVLANSQRKAYGPATSIVPEHWRVHTSGDERGATTVWQSCLPGAC